MIILGLTGGIGSGKTVVLNILKEEYDAYIIEADALAHELMRPGNEAYDSIVEAFGSGILRDDGEIDRLAFGNVVFHDEEKLKILNTIVHPAVKREILRLIDVERARDTKLFVIEAALLIQDGYKEICDYMCYVYADMDTRIKRLISGRGYTEKRAKDVMASQEDETFYRENTDFIIDNSHKVEDTRKQLLAYFSKEIFR